METTTIEIKNWVTNKVLFSYTCENNSFAKTLEEAVRKNVDLSVANLANIRLFNIDLSNVKLNCATFVNSHLNKINFNGANLENVNFVDSVLTDVTFDNAVGINDQCPKEGSFIGWKKCKTIRNHPYIVKLEIPADAKRSSGTDKKCRCSHAKVLEIQNLDGTVADFVDHVFSPTYKNNKICYRVSEIVYADSFDNRFWIECTNGIHFFMDRNDAIAW